MNNLLVGGASVDYTQVVRQQHDLITRCPRQTRNAPHSITAAKVSVLHMTICPACSAQRRMISLSPISAVVFSLNWGNLTRPKNRSRCSSLPRPCHWISGGLGYVYGRAGNHAE